MKDRTDLILYGSFDEKKELEKEMSKDLSREACLGQALDYIDFLAAFSSPPSTIGSSRNWIILRFKNDPSIK